MKETIIATKPHVVEAAKWYLYFSVRNPKTGKLCPIKIEKGFKQCETVEEKREFGKKLVKEYSAKLKRGWTPWQNDEYIFDDQIMYKNEADAYGSKRKSRGTVRMYASEYLEKQRPSLRPKGYTSYQSKFRIFCLWLEQQGYGEYDIECIDNKIILLFFDYLMNERDLDKVTIKTYRVKLKAFFNHMVIKRKISKNPVFDIPIGIKKCDNSPRPILPVDLKKLMLKICQDDPQLYLACMIQFFCAIRPGTELRLLKIKHIEFWTGNIHVNMLDSKTERDEIIGIPNQLSKLMSETYHLQNYNREFYVFSINGMPGATPLGKNNMRNRFNKFRDALELSEEYKYYSLKHTGAGMMMDSGKFNLKELMDHLRHTDINSTYHYIRRYKGNSNEKIREHFPSPYDKFGE